MKVRATSLPGVLLFEPDVHADARGWLFESWRGERYVEHGLPAAFAQHVVGRSLPGVVRGLHLQHPGAQGKLVHVLEGEVLDVAVDVRVGSPSFGRWVGERLSAANRRQLWLPPGFAHGFGVVGSEPALIAYFLTTPHRPEHEVTVRWDDPALAIPWPVSSPVLSARDAAAPSLAASRARLPAFASGAR